MSLTSEQAKEISARPRIPPEVEDQAVSMWAEGSSDVEVQARFPSWAVGTFRNLRGRKKAEIDDLRRQRTVQFSDVAGTRKQARIDDHWQIRTAYMMLFRKHLESCYAMDPVTGEKEFFEQLVDVKRLQMYSSEIRAELKALMIETGQQMQMPEEYTRYALGLNGGEGIDHAKMAQRRREEAAEKQALAEANRVWKAEHAEEVAEDEVDRLLNRAVIRKQAPPTLQRLANAAHEALEDIEDDEVHARVDRWLKERFPGGRVVVVAELVDQGSDVAVTSPNVVDHESVAAPVAAEQGQDMDVWRVMSPPAQAEELVPEVEAEPVSEPEPEPDVDEYAELRAAFVDSLNDVDGAGHDELMRALKADEDEFFAVLGQLTDEKLVSDSGTRLRLVRG